MNQKLIISKLLKLAGDQQKVIQKLAQLVQNVQDPNVAYLQRAWQTATVNSGVPQVSTPEVTTNPGSTQGNVQVGGTYTINATGIPQNNTLRQKLIDTFKTQVKTQKPDLDGKVSIMFV